MSIVKDSRWTRLKVTTGLVPEIRRKAASAAGAEQRAVECATTVHPDDAGIEALAQRQQHRS